MRSLYALIFITLLQPLAAQEVIELTPSADCVVGFHDGENSANENAGSASHFSSFWQPAWVGVGENGGYGLMQFDLSAIPVGSEIVSASLELKAFGDGFTPFLPEGHSGANACWLQRITEEWEEYEATWNTKPATTATGQIEVSASTDPYEDYTIDIKTFVQDMVNNPASNFGFAIKLQNESPTRGLMFLSSDDPDDANWPRLTVEYEEPTSIFNNLPESFEFKLFPNPVIDILNISLLNNHQQFTVDIYNSQGQCVINNQVVSNSQTIEVNQFAPGLYTLKLYDISKQVQSSQTFIKQ